MKTIRSVAATLALAGLLGVTNFAVADASQGENCRQETKRVAVWPKGAPKAQRMARFEERQVTVCDSKVASKRAAEEQLQAKDNDD